MREASDREQGAWEHTSNAHQAPAWRRTAHPGRGEGKPFPILLFADLPVTQPGDLVNVQRKISLLFNILHNVHPIQLVNRIMTCRRWECGDNSICAPRFPEEESDAEQR